MSTPPRPWHVGQMRTCPGRAIGSHRCGGLGDVARDRLTAMTTTMITAVTATSSKISSSPQPASEDPRSTMRCNLDGSERLRGDAAGHGGVTDVQRGSAPIPAGSWRRFLTRQRLAGSDAFDAHPTAADCWSAREIACHAGSRPSCHRSALTSEARVAEIEVRALPPAARACRSDRRACRSTAPESRPPAASPGVRRSLVSTSDSMTARMTAS